jgi:hypothetical protein
MSLLSEEDRYRMNVFDWNAEFPGIMQAGGFDAVIGNPPYVRQEMLSDFKSYLGNTYKTYHGVADLYVYFIERGMKLLKPGGRFGYIVANKWMRANYGERLRQWLKQQLLVEIVDFGDLPVFQTATTYPCILLMGRDSPAATLRVTQVQSLDFRTLDDYVQGHCCTVAQSSLEDEGWSLTDTRTQALLAKLRTLGKQLEDYVNGKIYYGIKTGFNEAFVIDAETRANLISEDPRSAELIKPFLAGREIKRYAPPSSYRFLIFTRRGVDIKKYPAIEGHLRPFKEQLMPKPKDWKGGDWKGRKPGPYQWYEIQDTVAYHTEFDKPKILLPDISARGNFTLDEAGGYSANTTYLICSSDLYLLGLLNSSLMDFYYRNLTAVYRGGYLRFFSQYMTQLPIRQIDFSNLADVIHHDRMVRMVQEMLSLHRQLATARTAHEQTAFKRQIDATDRQIDRLAYELYGLTEGEIRIVESTSLR